MKFKIKKFGKKSFVQGAEYPCVDVTRSNALEIFGELDPDLAAKLLDVALTKICQDVYQYHLDLETMLPKLSIERLQKEVLRILYRTEAERKKIKREQGLTLQKRISKRG